MLYEVITPIRPGILSQFVSTRKMASFSCTNVQSDSQSRHRHQESCNSSACSTQSAVMGSMIHGLTVPGAIEAAQRRNGFTKGWFEWLTRAPWGNPAFSGMFLSLVMFGFIGGIRNNFV